jgi:hypothetical protein
MLGEFVHKSRIYCIKSILDPVTPDEKEIKFKSLKDAQQFFEYVSSDPFSREELLEVAQWLRPTSCRPPKNCPKPSEQELLDMLCKMVYKNSLRGDFRLVELKPPVVGMSMDDKEKCAALYEAFTGEQSEPSLWNEKAADLLAKMAHEIKKCTQGMGWARSVWPSGTKVTWLWLIKIPYHALKNEMKVRKGWRNNACINAGVDAYKSSIFDELIR